MNTTKHTPGPWVIRNKDAVYAQSGRFIADCELTPYGSRPQPPNSTDEANAHLIAAAPAMYEALRQVKTALFTLADNAGDVPEWNEGGELYELSHTVKAALAQAEGSTK